MWMKWIVAGQDEKVYGIDKLRLHNPHNLIKKAWLHWVRGGRGQFPNREEVELSDDLWEQDILEIDRAYQWLNNDDPTFRAGEDLLAQKHARELAEAEAKRREDAAD